MTKYRIEFPREALDPRRRAEKGQGAYISATAEYDTIELAEMARAKFCKENKVLEYNVKIEAI